MHWSVGGHPPDVDGLVAPEELGGVCCAAFTEPGQRDSVRSVAESRAASVPDVRKTGLPPGLPEHKRLPALHEIQGAVPVLKWVRPAWATVRVRVEDRTGV
jgi:hypothetical protein